MKKLCAVLMMILALAGRVDAQSPTELYETASAAITAGDLATIERLLEAGFDVGFSPPEKGSLLHTAIYAKNHAAAAMLLEHRADLERQEGFYKGTPVMFAADNDDVEMVDLLLAHGADIDSRDGAFGDSAINWAAYAGHFEMVRHLLAKGADPRIVGHGNSLDIAMRRGFQPLVELLAEHMGETRALSAPEAALLAAIESADLERAAEALALSADPGSLDRFKRPLIAAAARRGSVEIVALLLAAGADVDATDPIGYTPLMEAARDRQLESVQLLLAHGADVNHVSRQRGLALTPLHLGAIGGSVEVVEALVNGGAQLDTRCSIGTTPLLWGLFEGSLEAGVRLIRLGADPTIATASGYDAADFAADYGEQELAAAISQWRRAHGEDG